MQILEQDSSRKESFTKELGVVQIQLRRLSLSKLVSDRSPSVEISACRVMIATTKLLIQQLRYLNTKGWLLGAAAFPQLMGIKAYRRTSG